MAQARHTAAHQRTRRDHASETAEDYVEAVAEIERATGSCRVVDLAARFGVSHVTVVRTLKRLEREGYLANQRQRPVLLTPKGQRLADHCRARHDVVYRFLLAIGLDQRTAAIDAEGIEHHVSPRTLERFREIADDAEHQRVEPIDGAQSKLPGWHPRGQEPNKPSV